MWYFLRSRGLLGNQFTAATFKVAFPVLARVDGLHRTRFNIWYRISRASAG
jgi:hypothetical protein